MNDAASGDMSTGSEDRPDIQQQDNVQKFSVRSDINSAAALRAQYAIETPKVVSRRRHKRLTKDESEEPLVDQTSRLTLHSKKTERLQRKYKKRSEKIVNARASSWSLNDLPNEILTEISSHLLVSDVFRLSRVSHFLHEFVQSSQISIARPIIQRRYWIIQRCFPLPVPLDAVPEEYHSGLLNERRQELLNIHRKSYHQHIEMVNPRTVCTCMTCVFAWNNLCLCIDLHHWQHNLANREPIPMIARGTNPEWNQQLLKRNADVVRAAVKQPLYYAAILEKHLNTITTTILRFAKWKKPGTKAKPRLYHLTDWDVDAGTDAFLDRSGPPSYDFPFHRDNYYSLEAYLPNRKWGNDGKWHYYPGPPTQHEKDLEWVKSTMSIIPTEQRKAQALANLKDHNIRWSQYLERLDST